MYEKPFENINIKEPNAPGVDLISIDGETCIQISSSGTTQKLYDTLRTFLKHDKYKKSSELNLFILGEVEDTFSQAQTTVDKIILEKDNLKKILNLTLMIIFMKLKTLPIKLKEISKMIKDNQTT